MLTLIKKETGYVFGGICDCSCISKGVLNIIITEEVVHIGLMKDAVVCQARCTPIYELPGANIYYSSNCVDKKTWWWTQTQQII